MPEQALNIDENAAVVRLLREVKERDFGGNQKALARKLGISDGLLSELLSPTPTRRAGMKVIRALASLTGKSLDEVTGRAPPTEPTVVLEPGARQRRLGDLPGWAESMAVAMLIFLDIPREAWEAAASLMTLKTPDHINPEVVYKITSGWYLAMTSGDQLVINKQVADRVDAERTADIAALEKRGITLASDPARFNIELTKLREERAGTPLDVEEIKALENARRERSPRIRAAKPRS